MRILINGKLYDSTETPILIVFDENEEELFNGVNRFVSAPESCTVEQRQELIDMDIDNFFADLIKFDNGSKIEIMKSENVIRGKQSKNIEWYHDR